jgi:hypothetical protein
MTTGFFMKINLRLFAALRASAYHLVGCIVVASIVASIVLKFWYPFPYGQLAGGQGLLLLLFSVDVVCGPVLTFILFSPQKTRKEFVVDLVVVVFIQCAALLYGLHVLAEARPIALIYEVDRFRVISRADIYEVELNEIPPWVSPWSFSAPRLQSLRRSLKGSELVESMELAGAGVELSQRPSRWQDYYLDVAEIKIRARNLSVLFEKYPGKSQLIKNYIVSGCGDGVQVVWLPLVSRHANDWIVFLSKNTLHPCAFFRANGFI